MSFPNLKRGANQREVEDAINRLYQGKNNSVVSGPVTLTSSSATTTFTHPLLTATCHISPMPTTANAAAELGTLYFTNRGDKTVTINHQNLGTTISDRIYILKITG